MFPEYRDLISRLKNENPRFMSLFDKHNKLDHEIARKEGSDGRGYNAEVVRMKKQKLQLKDEMLKILQQCKQRMIKHLFYIAVARSEHGRAV